jgi:hypothetical protein
MFGKSLPQQLQRQKLSTDTADIDKKKKKKKSMRYFLIQFFVTNTISYNHN